MASGSGLQSNSWTEYVMSVAGKGIRCMIGIIKEFATSLTFILLNIVFTHEHTPSTQLREMQVYSL